MAAVVTFDRYTHGELHVTAHRFHPKNVHIFRFPLRPTSLPKQYALYRDEFAYYLVTPEQIEGERVAAWPLSPVRDVVTRAVVTSRPQLLALHNPTEEMRTMEFYRETQRFMGEVPKDYLVTVTIEPPKDTSITLPPSVTAGYSDTTIAFVLLFVAMFFIVFLSSRQQNWVAYHD